MSRSRPLNRYQNPRYNLSYGRADATAFVDSLLTGAKGIFTQVIQDTLYDTVATGLAIKARLRVARAPNERDIMRKLPVLALRRGWCAVIALAIPLGSTAAHAQGQLGLIMSAAKMTMGDLGGAKIPDARGFYGGFEGPFLASLLFLGRHGIVLSDAAWLMFDVSGPKGAFGDFGYQLLMGYNTGALGVYGGARIQKNSANIGGSSQRGSTDPFTAMIRVDMGEGKHLVVSGWGGSWRGGLKSSGARFVLPFSGLWSVTGSYERTIGPVDYGSTTVAGTLTLLSLGVRFGT